MPSGCLSLGLKCFPGMCKGLRTQSLDLVEILYYDEQLQSMCCQSRSYSKNGG